MVGMILRSLLSIEARKCHMDQHIEKGYAKVIRIRSHGLHAYSKLILAFSLSRAASDKSLHI